MYGYLSALLIIFTACSSISNSDVEGNADNPRLLKNEMRQYEAVLEKSTGNAAVYRALAWSQLYDKEHDKAVKNFNLSLKTEISANAYVGLGIAYEGLGHIQYAIQSNKEALKLEPQWQYVRYRLGKLYAKQGRKEKAMEMLDYLIASNKDLARNLMDVLY